MMFPHPLDGGLQVGIGGDDDHGLRAMVDGVVHEADGDIDVGLFLFAHTVFQMSWAGTGLTRDGALLVFS